MKGNGRGAFMGGVPLVGRAGAEPLYPSPCPSGIPVEQEVTVEVEIEGRTIPVTAKVTIPTSVHLQVYYTPDGAMRYRMCNVCRGRGFVMTSTQELVRLAATLGPIEKSLRDAAAQLAAKQEDDHAGEASQEGA
jgi:hypothetical protein